MLKGSIEPAGTLQSRGVILYGLVVTSDSLHISHLTHCGQKHIDSSSFKMNINTLRKTIVLSMSVYYLICQ